MRKRVRVPLATDAYEMTWDCVHDLLTIQDDVGFVLENQNLPDSTRNALENARNLSIDVRVKLNRIAAKLHRLIVE
jgi:hypothetical protein